MEMKKKSGDFHIPYRIRNSLIILLFVLPLLSFANEIDLKLEPNPLFVGEIGVYHLISRKAMPKLLGLPSINGIQWLSPLHPQRHPTGATRINAKTVYRLSYRFVVDKAGSYRFPKNKVRVAGRIYDIPAYALTVHERKTKPEEQGRKPPDELLFLTLEYDHRPRAPQAIYRGEAIPLTIKMYCHESLQFQASLPKFELEGIPFQSYYPQKNGVATEFIHTESSEIHEGSRYKVIRYHSILWPLEPGTIEGSIQQSVFVKDPLPRTHKNLFSHSFFEEFFWRNDPEQIYELTIQFPAVTVKALPDDSKIPGDNLYLVGDWQVDLNLEKTEVAVGDAIELRLLATGTGNNYSLQAPKLALPGFRIYEPKISYTETLSESRVLVKWQLVPSQVEATFPELQFKTFNPKTSQYVLHKFSRQLTVIPSVSIASSPKNKHLSEKEELVVVLPLWQDMIFLLSSFVGLILALFFLMILARHRSSQSRQKVESSTQFQTLPKQRHDIITMLCSAQPDQLVEMIQKNVLPYLRVYCNLSPGASTTELFAHLKNKALEENLKQAEHADFSLEKPVLIDKYRLIKALKSLD